MLSPKYKIQQFALKQVLGYLKKDPQKNLPKIMEWVRKFDTENIYVDQYDMIEEYLRDPNNNWTQLMCNIINNVHPKIVQTVFTNFLLNASIRGWAEIQKNKEKYGHEIPFTILVDPIDDKKDYWYTAWKRPIENKIKNTFKAKEEKNKDVY